MFNRVFLRVKRKVRHTCGMARDDLHFRLRIPEALKAQIEASAKANNRSMTAEMVSRLERSFDLDSDLNTVSDTVDDHEYRLDKLEEQMREVIYAINQLDRRR